MGEPGDAVQPLYARSWALDGIEILRAAKGGDGRTVEAYAAVFDVPTEITDGHGHYMEVIHRSAFNRTLSHGTDRVGVYYHHGLTIHGTPSDLGSVPIGSPVDIRADAKGLRTVTRLNRSPLADSVLEAIRNNDIRGYSFRGGIFRSTPSRVPRARAGAALPTVTRTELGLSEYGPTPTPAYVGASIEALRSMLSDVLQRSTPARDSDGDDPEQTATPDEPGPGAEDPRVAEQAAHSARHHLLRLRAAVRDRGM
jgi:HK97 family phage prohead protease